MNRKETALLTLAPSSNLPHLLSEENFEASAVYLDNMAVSHQLFGNIFNAMVLSRRISVT